jgi:hypothetical protein
LKKGSRGKRHHKADHKKEAQGEKENVQKGKRNFHGQISIINKCLQSKKDGVISYLTQMFFV